MPSLPSPEVYYKSPQFSLEHTQANSLICSVAEHQITLLVTDRMKKPLFVQRILNRKKLSVQEFTAEFFEQATFVQQDFMFKQVLLHSERWMLLPDKAYTVGAEAEIMSIQHSVNADEDEFIMDAIAPLSVRTLYATSHDLLEFFRSRFGETVQFRHVISQAIRQCHRVQTKTSIPLLGMLELIDYELIYTVFENNELVFGNFLRLVNEADVVQYMRTINKTLGFDPSKFRLALVGISPMLPKLQAELSSKFQMVPNLGSQYGNTAELEATGFRMQDYSHLIIPVV
jgi:hypothetical protein